MTICPRWSGRMCATPPKTAPIRIMNGAPASTIGVSASRYSIASRRPEQQRLGAGVDLFIGKHGVADLLGVKHRPDKAPPLGRCHYRRIELACGCVVDLFDDSLGEAMTKAVIDSWGVAELQLSGLLEHEAEKKARLVTCNL